MYQKGVVNLINTPNSYIKYIIQFMKILFLKFICTKHNVMTSMRQKIVAVGAKILIEGINEDI